MVKKKNKAYDEGGNSVKEDRTGCHQCDLLQRERGTAIINARAKHG